MNYRSTSLTHGIAAQLEALVVGTEQCKFVVIVPLRVTMAVTQDGLDSGFAWRLLFNAVLIRESQQHREVEVHRIGEEGTSILQLLEVVGIGADLFLRGVPGRNAVIGW